MPESKIPIHMSDPLSIEQRHNCMSHIRGKNTKAEIKLRKSLFALGYRYRINVKGLAGSPDIVFPKYHTCIFVNGCFWHGHQGCSKYTTPKTNTDFWVNKVANNRERDLRNYRDLESKGWRVIVVWECELEKNRLQETVSRVEQQLILNRESWLIEAEGRRRRSAVWKSELENRKKRELSAIEEIEDRF